MAVRYPVKAGLEIYITDGQQVGSVTYGMGLYQLPTEQDMPEILEKVTSALPPGFRLMSRHESMMHFLREERGYRGPNLALGALDAGDVWHDPETAETYSTIGDEPDFDEEDEE